MDSVSHRVSEVDLRATRLQWVGTCFTRTGSASSKQFQRSGASIRPCTDTAPTVRTAGRCVLASAIFDALRLPPRPALVCYLAAVTVIAAGYAFDESTCLWHAITGLPCPGCGMIHAFLSIARGDLHAAWAFNRGSFVALPVLLWTGLHKVKELC